jgi:hypothetical protein
MLESKRSNWTRAARLKQFLPRKSLYRYSKEITKPAIFAQPIAL